jgi:hypothetical protein
MKHLKTILALAVVAFAMAIASISTAQYPDPRLEDFLNHHPDVRAELQRNPNLIFDRQFRSQHAELEEFMQTHPGTWGKLPNATRWGGYGPDHSWHDRDWWNSHDPNWVRDHHPEWAANAEHHAAEGEHYQGNPYVHEGTPANQPHHDHHGDHNPY